MSSPPDAWRALPSLFARWNRWLPSMGTLALAALAVAVATGVPLAAGYDIGKAADSVALLELSSRAGRVLRGLHAWSSHLLIALALLHAIEHFAGGGDQRPARGVWLRVVGSIPFLFGIALSGFMLKGDAEGELARSILSGLLDRVPLAGKALSTALLGAGTDLQTVYLHHVATLTLLVLLVTIEHGRRLWPPASSVLGIAGGALLLAWLFPPAIHDGVDPVVKGPWYFVALQEAMHWLSQPAWIWLLLAAPLVVLAWLPRLEGVGRQRALGALAAALVAYVAVSLFAGFFRGAGWDLVAPWGMRGPSSRGASAVVAPMTWARLDESVLPEILGRREGCVACHAEVTGLSPSHDPKAIGCFSCHLGNPASADTGGAHAGMVRVPGNLDTAALSCGRCHEAVVGRVRKSLMSTLHGMIAVDRWAFGEQRGQDATHAVADLGSSPADIHLRQLCVGCHLGHLKDEPGTVTELSRGGGCSACHVSYPAQRTYAKDNASRFAHPAVSVQVRDESCFGCHSRSGRISLGYAGFWESGLTDAQAAQLPPGSWNRLADGRIVRKASEDAHHAKGMACIDCHTAQEVMGDGKVHLHEESATRVRCETCHRLEPAKSVARSELLPEASAIVRLRPDAAERFLIEDRSNEALTNATPLPDGTVEVRGKLSGARLIAKPPSASCTRIDGHARLSCRACHETWVTQCVSCHTQWDGRGRRRDVPTGKERAGAWVEYDVAPRVGPPALGVVSRDGREEIVPFAPGMIMSLNGPDVPAPSPLPASAVELVGPGTRFLRAYAPVVPHTTTRHGLSCPACHLDPQVLGYGRGKLTLAEEGGRWRWRFEPAYEKSLPDGLPADAWIGFLDGRPGTATRASARSLTLDEQRAALSVGACLGCHDPDTPQGRELYTHFRERRAGPKCRVPATDAADGGEERHH